MIVWFGIFFLFSFILFQTILFIMYYYCIYTKKQVPLVASSINLRKITVAEIQRHYKSAKNVLEIGSGFGGMMRYIAHKTHKNVIGVENIFWYAFISKILNIFCFNKTTTILCDAFKYLDSTDKSFDIAIAYIGPTATNKIYRYKNKIKTFISLDFPIANITPTRIIDIGHGNTIIGKNKYPHKLYVYNFNKNKKRG